MPHEDSNRIRTNYQSLNTNTASKSNSKKKKRALEYEDDDEDNFESLLAVAGISSIGHTSDSDEGGAIVSGNGRGGDDSDDSDDSDGVDNGADGKNDDSVSSSTHKKETTPDPQVLSYGAYLKTKKRRLELNPNRHRLARETKELLMPLFPHSNILFQNSSHSRIHIEILGHTLRHLLLKRDYQRAYRLYSSMISLKGTNEEFWWKIGSELLQQKSEYEPNCVMFLKTMYAKATKCKLQVLIETGLYLMRCGRFEDAHDTMEPHAESRPYSEDSKFLGSLGMIEYALWHNNLQDFKKMIQDRLGTNESQKSSNNDRTQRSQSMDMDEVGSQSTLVHRDDAGHRLSDDDDDDDMYIPEELDGDYEVLGVKSTVLRYRKNATGYFERALRLHNRNDMYLASLMVLQCGMVDIRGVHGKISRTRLEKLHDMREYLTTYLESNHDKKVAVEAPHREKTLKRILTLDPAANSDLYVVPWIQILTQQNIPADQAVIVNEIGPTNDYDSKLPSNLTEQDLLYSLQYRDTNPSSMLQELSSRNIPQWKRERRLIPWKKKSTTGSTVPFSHTPISSRNNNNNNNNNNKQTKGKNSHRNIRSSRNTSPLSRTRSFSETSTMEVDDANDIAATTTTTTTPDRETPHDHNHHETIVRALDRHQPNVAYFRPILELLLARAEFGVLTEWEESELNRIVNLFCFCSLYCRRVQSINEIQHVSTATPVLFSSNINIHATGEETATTGTLPSYFDQMPESWRPHWYSKLVQILARPNDF
ncbi:hypothetical protein BG004_003774 [Podila humilis]|nr:hypothetical protein BG004_003774 [Podila humilis]